MAMKRQLMKEEFSDARKEAPVIVEKKVTTPGILKIRTERANKIINSLIDDGLDMPEIQKTVCRTYCVLKGMNKK